ncbi:periplasmic sensor signal transduction histidine kinase [Pseudooceanicola batsensis HTCC2597]|uniref:histidine kinase n=1 Tax=Pseudooceanicola batsensis (strain ATCC BAA-863 / DSM 15984 / KCTC 12145 / HTCC2597) TaxID=252305 RepID=A3TVK7_PSEBH|nr:sensor histidine kinase [Pseudooceanicola batsensis]EAQ03653.1 periplasmic sensor signal transduction histidine kinase [Pseudooceanicola batsensis HTCC2597]
MRLPFIDKLGVRVVAMLSIALLPIGLISLYQTRSVVDKAEALTRSAYLGQTVSATERQSDLIHEGFASARVLGGAVITMRDDIDACSALMSGFIRSHPAFSLALFVEPSGVTRCNSRDTPLDVRSTATFRQIDSDPRPLMNATEEGRVTGQSVMVIAQPVYDEGEYAGFVTLSLPRANARFEPEFDGPTKPLELITVNQRGEVLLSMGDLDAAPGLLPAFRDLNSQLYKQFSSFWALDRNGVPRVYSTTPIIPGEVLAVSVWPVDSVSGETGFIERSAMLFPLLMWLVSLVVAYFAVHRLVIRHVRQLRRKVRGFGTTQAYPPPGLLAGGHAPVELVQMEETFDAMVERITRDTAELENNLHEKNVLLKEVHHRVKNNLQLIASIINMEVRKAPRPETKSTLRRIQDRVLGLATVHSNLYHTARLANLRADGLLEDILDQVVKSALPQGSPVQVSVGIEEVVLSPDKAVPLSLLATETVINAIKYVGRPGDGAAPWIKITLEDLDGRSCRFCVTNSRGDKLRDSEDPAEGSGLGRQLIDAFASQLGTRPEVTETDETYRMCVDIALS